MPLNQNLLNKYFSGLCSEQEKKMVLGWLLDPRNERLARKLMHDHWNNFTESDHKLDIESLLSKTRARLADHDAIAAPKRKARSLGVISARLAASLVLISVTLAVLLSVIKTDTYRGLSFVTQTQQVRTSTGQIILKVLPDGTKVWLNAQSTLDYPSSFGETREVRLKGEAFFDVVKDNDHPFIVQADGITIRVLGTAFNIKSYPGDPSVATTLVEGKVMIEKRDGLASDTLALNPDQQAVFSRSSHDIRLLSVDARRYASWIDGSLVFEDHELYDVLKTLERWYGVTIHVVEESSLRCRLTARIDNETITETLELLKSTTGIDYVIDGKEVTIEGKVCSP